MGCLLAALASNISAELKEEDDEDSALTQAILASLLPANPTPEAAPNDEIWKHDPCAARLAGRPDLHVIVQMVSSLVALVGATVLELNTSVGVLLTGVQLLALATPGSGCLVGVRDEMLYISGTPATSHRANGPGRCRCLFTTNIGALICGTGALRLVAIMSAAVLRADLISMPMCKLDVCACLQT